MSKMASQITSFSIVCSTIYTGADQSKHQSSASLAFVQGIHRWPVNSPHKGPVMRKMFPFDDVIMHNKIVYKHWWSRMGNIFCLDINQKLFVRLISFVVFFLWNAIHIVLLQEGNLLVIELCKPRHLRLSLTMPSHGILAKTCWIHFATSTSLSPCMWPSAATTISYK